MPRGKLLEICCKRSDTSCRAKYIGTDSSKTIVTIDSPGFASERTSSLFGRPSSARSGGNNYTVAADSAGDVFFGSITAVIEVSPEGTIHTVAGSTFGFSG